MNFLDHNPNDKKKANHKNVRSKKSRIFVSLVEKDRLLLIRYCELHNISQTEALKRIVRQFLQENADQNTEKIAENQLDLFEPTQMNIFDVIR